MANTGLLVLSNIKQFGNTLKSIEKLVNTLYIQLNVPSSPKINPLPTWGRLISQLYLDGDNSLTTNIDMRILLGPLREMPSAKMKLKPVDMIFSDCKQQMDLCQRLQKELNIPSNKIMILEEASVNDIMEFYMQSQDKDQVEKLYDNVVLGGTFDRIHIGHKIFLSHAVLRAAKRLVVGVTTAEMTKSKTLYELILPVERRIEEVSEFLKEIDSNIRIEVVPIEDGYGPTKVDPNMDLIVVSKETYRGAVKINEIRAENNLSQLDIYCMEMIECSLNSGPKETKVSSSNIRIDLLGTRIKQPEPRPHLPERPYIIGLTGGIATGKSRMAQRFKELGAVIMDCDKIAHEVYEPGQKCYNEIIAAFGPDVVGEDKKIDRAKLGAIVFSNVEQLEKLNNIVWPELLEEVKRRIDCLDPCPQVVVIEAAVLLRAGWETECHEVWSMIVPENEAISRIMKRNNLSEDEARKRISSQLSNVEIVRRSNVIFSSQWDHDYTTLQANKAWDMLMNDLNKKN